MSNAVWVKQNARQIRKYGVEAASWYCEWNDDDGTRRCKSCGPGVAGKRIAHELAERIRLRLMGDEIFRDSAIFNARHPLLYFTIEEVASILRIDKWMVIQLAETGRLQAFCLDGPDNYALWRISAENLRTFVESKSKGFCVVCGRVLRNLGRGQGRVNTCGPKCSEINFRAVARRSQLRTARKKSDLQCAMAIGDIYEFANRFVENRRECRTVADDE